MKQRNFKILWLLLIFMAVGIMPKAANAQQALRFCNFEKPKYIVKMATTRTRYIRGKSARDLTEMHTGRSGNNVGGLGGGEIGYKISSEFEVMEQNKQFCVGLKSAKITLYGKPQIHIASNFRRGSCEYTAVLGHEQNHIRIMRKFLREYAPKFKKEVKRIAKSSRTKIGPMSKDRVARAQEDLQQQLTDAISRYLHKISPVLSSRQKGLDNPKEYSRVFAKCKNWDEKFSKSR